MDLKIKQQKREMDDLRINPANIGFSGRYCSESWFLCPFNYGLIISGIFEFICTLGIVF